MPQQNFTIEYGLTVGNANITASSGNIATSGNLSANSISLTGGITVTGVSNLGNIGNVIITGGSSGYAISTDGTGNLSWVALDQGTGSVNNGTASQLAYYAASGNAVSETGANLTWNGSNLLSVTGNVSATYLTGTLTTASQPNITSVGTLSSLSVTGNVSAGNVSGTTITGNVTSTGTSSFYNITVSNLTSVTSNVDSSGITTGAIVTAGGLGVAKNAYFGQDVNIAGNLYVTGNTTIVDANDITIADKTFILANNAGSGALADGAGLLVGNVSVATVASWLYHHSTTSWQSNIDITPTSNIALDLGDPALYWRNLYSANVYGTIQTAAQPNITSVGTLSSLSVTGNVSAGNVSGTYLTGTLETAAQPNITSVGTLSSLSLSGNITTTGNIELCQLKVNNCNVATAIVNQTAGGYGNIGAAGQGFDTVFARQASANNADLAEIYVSDTMYEYGTVMVFGGNEEVTASTMSHDPRIAGVVSQQPAFLMNDTASGVPIALTGRVPCRVLGPVAKGSLLVSSNLPGIACALDLERYRPGCVIGKSLEEINSISVQLIEVVVGRL